MNISYITLNRIVEGQIAKDPKYRQEFARTGRPLLSTGRQLAG